ncbi:MAG: hypothetical protein ACSLFN_15260 [Candidatus Limnocylindrales bacterium]
MGNQLAGTARRLATGIILGTVVAAVIAACSAAGTATLSPSPVAGKLILQADTVWGPKNIAKADLSGRICVQRNLFARNEEIVWRVKVIDPATGEPMDDQVLSSLAVTFADQSLDLRYGPHPKDNPADYFWTVSWLIPEDHPTGELPYTIEATAKDGRTGTFEQFGVSLARLTITDEIRPTFTE